ncbi:MAG: helix-turn-helix transcriptional regulator [Clostridiales bacterium]|nr:helix-turn-helix transcriptional regulator [Clostridiales bacterium]
MILNTVGFNYYINYIFPVLVTTDLNTLMVEEAGEYYKILHIKSGICRFNLNGKEYVIIGAHILHLNDQDKIYFNDVSNSTIRIILFRPKIVNTSFNFNIINDPQNKLTGAANQDLFYLKQFKHDSTEDIKILPLMSINSTILEHKIDCLNNLLTKQDTLSWPCLSRSYLYEILFALVRQGELKDDGDSLENYSGHSKLAVDIIYYIQNRYNEKISIDSLVKEFHTNRTTLHMDFKEHTGLSINQYLLQIRMNMAAKLLRDTGLSLSEICERIGYSDTTYFGKVFKKTLNQSPSEYRHNYR